MYIYIYTHDVHIYIYIYTFDIYIYISYYLRQGSIPRARFATIVVRIAPAGALAAPVEQRVPRQMLGAVWEDCAVY